MHFGNARIDYLVFQFPRSEAWKRMAERGLAASLSLLLLWSLGCSHETVCSISLARECPRAVLPAGSAGTSFVPSLRGGARSEAGDDDTASLAGGQEGTTEAGAAETIQEAVEPTLDEAGELWRRAVDASPTDAALLFEYALFLQDDKADWLAAEGIYKKVLALEPTHVAALCNYANILGDKRKDFDGAERAIQSALLLNPSDGTALANYASLILDWRGETRRAQELYLYSLRADPSNTATL